MLIMHQLFSLSIGLIFILLVILLKYRSIGGRRMPGPLALPVIGHLHLLEPLLHHSFHRLSTTFGPIFHLKIGSQPCVVISSPELAKVFLKTHELKFSSRNTSSTATRLLTYNCASFAFAPYAPYWKYVKRLFTNEFLGTRNTGHFSLIRTRENRGLLNLLADRARASETVNLSEELAKLINNISSQMMLSSKSSGTKGDAEEMRRLVREVAMLFGEFNVSDFISLLKNIDVGGFKKRCKSTQKRYDAMLEKIISVREREREGIRAENSGELVRGEGKSKDFLDMMLDAMEDGNCEVHITRDHIKASILDFLSAATDTTATSIEWALSELINNPHVLKKAQDEIENVIGSQRLVQESDSVNLPYIQAIIKENFRIHPPTPLILRNSVEECIVDGYHIPTNTILFINVWSIGRNPKYWENPMEFRPERFLKSDGFSQAASIDIKGHNFELLPFGSGRRGCPGLTLAMQELQVFLATVIQNFNWKPTTLVEDKLDMSERHGLTAPRVNDLVCIPVIRNELL